MDFSWTAHQFVGGALAFDVANTVILREDPQRICDRLADVPVMQTFVSAARKWCHEQDLCKSVRLAEPNGKLLVVLRESIDRHFRDVVRKGAAGGHLPQLLRDAANALEMPGTMENATAVSALKLAFETPVARIKACENCGWLFVDRSKNASRIWCDMAVCGNRQKAKRHYRKLTGEPVQ